MIKKSVILSIVFFTIAFLRGSAHTSENLNPEFEIIKSLKGDWVGEWLGGSTKGIRTTFRFISGGSSVMQIVNDHHGEMMTTYYPDGEHLMVTHYCNANNQPRLRSNSSPGGKVMTFSFQDATNMASDEEGHIEKLVMTFQDSDHIRQDWTWREGGATRTDTLSFTRSK